MPVERMASPVSDRDPFANTADADAYVPRTATESVLVELEMALRDGARVAILGGPAGSGKTLLLRVLEERLAGDFAPLRVPYTKLDPDEFCRWGLDALGGRADAEPEHVLAARIARGAASGDPPILWVIDDADLLPIATLRTLLGIQRGTGDALRFLFARTSELLPDEFAQSGVMPVHVSLEGEMDSAEMERYVRARLDRASTDPDQRAVIEEALDRLYARSRGNPGRLHAAAAALICFGSERLALPEEPAPRVEPERDEIAANGAHAAGVAPEPVDPERISIESLVAEAVAAEVDEVAIVQPEAPTAHTALVATEPDPAAAMPPTRREEPAASEPAPSDPSPPALRKRHRLRRLGRR
jgi:type II secretory pathway predicted ATPase ExeA